MVKELKLTNMENMHYLRYQIQELQIGLQAKADSIIEGKQKLQGLEDTIHQTNLMEAYMCYLEQLIMEQV